VFCYLLKVYLNLEVFRGKTAKEFEKAHSKLHENIRDCGAEAKICILAPPYQANSAN
jgi:hypothetical protein